MTLDAMKGINGLRSYQLNEAARLLAFSSQLCERILADQGDHADMQIVQHQHDVQQWRAGCGFGQEGGR